MLVIGSGPGGQKAAIAAAKLGRRVAVVDRPDMVGGHSFGELTALRAAGRIGDAALAMLAQRRGALMADCAARGSGSMLAAFAPIEQVAAAIHEQSLDVVIANAGIKGATGPIASYPEDSFDLTLAVHVRGAFLLAKHAVPYLSRGASIIFTSSVVGLTAAPQIAGYSTAKHAQVGLMRTIAAELAPHGIRVNTIHPGPVDNEFQHIVEEAATGTDRDTAATIFTGMIPLGRHAAPDEIARAMLFLASDDSSFMTGATLSVDGGMSS